MPKFVKRPVMVEAEQFFLKKPMPFNDSGVVRRDDIGFFVVTIHGQRTDVIDGDWIILEPRGRLNAYPCKPDVFEASYQPVG